MKLLLFLHQISHRLAEISFLQLRIVLRFFLICVYNPLYSKRLILCCSETLQEIHIKYLMPPKPFFSF